MEAKLKKRRKQLEDSRQREMMRRSLPSDIFNIMYGRDDRERDREHEEIEQATEDAEDREMERELRRLQIEEARAAKEQREREEMDRLHEGALAMRAREKEEIGRAHDEGLKDQEERYNASWKGWAANKLGRGKYQKPPKAGEEPDEDQGEGQGGSTFGSTVLNVTVKSGTFWKSMAVIIFLILVAGGALHLLGRLNVVLTLAKAIGPILLYNLWIVVVIGSFVYGVKNFGKDKGAALFIAFAFFVWLLDRAPFGLFSEPYAGFYFDLTGTLKTDLFAIGTSSIIFIGLGLYAFTDALKGKVRWLITVAVIIIILRFYGWVAKKGLTEFAYGTAGFAVIAFLLGLAFFLGKKLKETESYLSFVIMILVLSYFWINFGWAETKNGSYNYRAVLHMIFMISFCLLYVRRIEPNPIVWHMVLPVFIISDFFLYDIVSESSFFGLFPILPLFALMICAFIGKSGYAEAMLVLVVVILISITAVNSLGDIYPQGSAAFQAREGSVETKDALSSTLNKLTDYWQGRLDYATGGLYRAQVEQNQYENLGVYFVNLRKAEPVFYTTEPVTVWGTIRSKTYQDPVVVDVNCYKEKDERKLYADRRYPGKPFPVFKLEENDIECTFLPPSSAKTQATIEAGQNKITLSAQYNFATNAYKKSYLIDRDRYRALVREDIDPREEFGIKDKEPSPVSTNGPVELSISVSHLLPVSNSYIIPPVVAVALLNRQEVQDKDKKVISRWDGRIKEITELIILTPPNVIIPLEDCNPPVNKCPCEAPFVPYDVKKCSASCKKYVLDSCNSACLSDKGCQAECEIASGNCGEDCNNLFEVSFGEGDRKSSYNAYALDIEKFKQDDRLKDIDRNKKFECRIFPHPNALDNAPITTRYFRARARYNYTLENSVIVNVKEAPKEFVGPVNSEFKPDIQKDFYFSRRNANELALSETVYSKARIHNVDYLFVKAIIQTENEPWDSNARGDGGKSFGLMQVHEDTVALIPCDPKYKTNVSLNIDCGVRYIQSLMNVQKEKRLIAGPENLAAGYNCGEGGMHYSTEPGYENKPVWQTPNGCIAPTTRTTEYVKRFKSNYDKLLKQVST